MTRASRAKRAGALGQARKDPLSHPILMPENLAPYAGMRQGPVVRPAPAVAARRGQDERAGSSGERLSAVCERKRRREPRSEICGSVQVMLLCPLVRPALLTRKPRRSPPRSRGLRWGELENPLHATSCDSEPELPRRAAQLERASTRVEPASELPEAESVHERYPREVDEGSPS